MRLLYFGRISAKLEDPFTGYPVADHNCADSFVSVGPATGGPVAAIFEGG